MSPEQARGEEVDQRTDLFSFGILLYEMATGALPFDGRSTAEIFTGILTGEPVAGEPAQPTRARPALDEILARSLAKDRARRYQTASEVRSDLERLLRDRASGAPPRPAFFSVGAAGRVAGGGGHGRDRLDRGRDRLLAGRRPAAIPEAGAAMIAVLPFENQGAADDEYFADGIADEIRGKLTGLSGLRVIARGSSTPYKRTTKTPLQIAGELGVRYLLTATLRWEKGTGRVFVIPELVEVAGGAAPVTKWQQRFDGSIADVFQVQAEIADRVARALDVALGTKEAKHLGAPPTRNLQAYDAYLRGEAASKGMTAVDPASLRRAIGGYDQAVALDPGFVEAWARLGRAHSLLYLNGTPTPEGATRARVAAERALALAPTGPTGTSRCRITSGASPAISARLSIGCSMRASGPPAMPTCSRRWPTPSSGSAAGSRPSIISARPRSSTPAPSSPPGAWESCCSCCDVTRRPARPSTAASPWPPTTSC